MRKKLITGVAVSAAMASIVPAMSAAALPLPTYRANEKTGFIISRIIPAEQYLELKYERISEKFEGVSPERIYIDYGDNITDYDLYLMQYAWHAPGATMVYAGMARNLLSDWDAETAVITSSQLRAGADLTQTTRLEYNVATTEWFNMVGRADFSRCVNSSVYQNGMATECRAEERSDGKLQYQPYTSSGERVEIPEEEDKLLTAKTDNWVPNSGVWGDEWYELGEDGGEEPGSGEPSSDSGAGGDEPSDDNEAGKDDERGESSETDDRGERAGNEGNGADGGSSSKDEQIDVGAPNNEADGSRVDTASAEEDKFAVETATSNGVTTSAASDGATAGSSSDGAGTDSASGATDVGSETVQEVASLMREDGAGEIENVDSETEVNTEVADSEGGENTAEENLAVPELGKETGAIPGWLSAFLVALGTFAVIMLWWLLFFGIRKKDKERKEEES